MIDLTRDNLDAELLGALPELRERYQALLQWWGEGEPGKHVVFGSVVNPFVDSLLASEENQNETTLRRVFGFLETMAISKDEVVLNVLAVTVCEHLTSDSSLLARARMFMGPFTKATVDAVQRWWEQMSKDTERES